MRRRNTSKDRLEIEWNLPVYAPDLDKKVDEGRTSSGYIDVALPRNEAFLHIRGKDHRPLLIVRECGLCKGSDDALMDRRIDNEKTILFTKWFHCVKLPNHVLKANHPFRQLFTQKHPPHLFLASWDGSTVIPMTGLQSQGVLWKNMEKMLKAHYKKDSKRAVKEVIKLLSHYDYLDASKAELEDRYEEELVKRGPKSPKLKQLKKKMDSLEKKRKLALARESKIRNLELRPLDEDGQKRFEAQKVMQSVRLSEKLSNDN